MRTDIKIRLLQLGKRQLDLLFELRKRGFPKISKTTLSDYIRGAETGPQSIKVLETCETILDEWEAEQV